MLFYFSGCRIKQVVISIGAMQRRAEFSKNFRKRWKSRSKIVWQGCVIRLSELVPCYTRSPRPRREAQGQPILLDEGAKEKQASECLTCIMSHDCVGEIFPVFLWKGIRQFDGLQRVSTGKR